jgi:hypothetical protein
VQEKKDGESNLVSVVVRGRRGFFSCPRKKTKIAAINQKCCNQYGVLRRDRHKRGKKIKAAELNQGSAGHRAQLNR